MFIMKKKLVAVISLFVIILIGGYTVYSSQNNVKLSDLVLANVEALAEYESPDVEITCNGQKILLLVDAGISMLIVIWGGFIILKIADFLVV